MSTLIEVVAVCQAEKTVKVRALVLLSIGKLRPLDVRRRRRLDAVARLHGVVRWR